MVAEITPTSLSIALASSIVDNAQTHELATLLAGQVARAAAIYRVDEIVILDEPTTTESRVSSGAAFLARILQYLETPQYLRRALIPKHDDLCHVGILPPLDAPHHMRANEWCRFREATVLSSDAANGSLLNAGLAQDAHVPECLAVGSRVTLDMGEQSASNEQRRGGKSSRAARLTTPLKPAKEGLYWGYQIRVATNMKALIHECPFKGGYDLVIGTSEHGAVASAEELALPSRRHVLVVFGGPRGLEDHLARDGSAGSADPAAVFDRYVNTCAGQGSRTIRTEEAILITLAFLSAR